MEEGGDADHKQAHHQQAEHQDELHLQNQFSPWKFFNEANPRDLCSFWSLELDGRNPEVAKLLRAETDSAAANLMSTLGLKKGNL